MTAPEILPTSISQPSLLILFVDPSFHSVCTKNSNFSDSQTMTRTVVSHGRTLVSDQGVVKSGGGHKGKIQRDQSGPDTAVVTALLPTLSGEFKISKVHVNTAGIGNGAKIEVGEVHVGSGQDFTPGTTSADSNRVVWTAAIAAEAESVLLGQSGFSVDLKISLKHAQSYLVIESVVVELEE